jgi:predicted transcriptional regulator
MWAQPGERNPDGERTWPRDALTVAGSGLREGVEATVNQTFAIQTKGDLYYYDDESLWFTAPSREHCLLALRALARMRRVTEFETALLVALARYNGWSWQEVASAAGRTKQHLHKMYSQLAPQIIQNAISSSEDEFRDFVDRNFEIWEGPEWAVTRSDPRRGRTIFE